MSTFLVFVRAIVSLSQRQLSEETCVAWHVSPMRTLHATDCSCPRCSFRLYSKVLTKLVLALAAALTWKACALPLLGVAIKWVVVGRFREGRYPLW
jgi:hypothetical protein